MVVNYMDSYGYNILLNDVQNKLKTHVARGREAMKLLSLNNNTRLR
jgi:hypothetical protein